MTSSSILRNPGFKNLWLGQCVSQLGDAFYYVVFAFMVHRITGSYAMVGWVAAVELLPYLAIGPFAGVLVDRVDRRKVMLASDLLSALVLGLLALVVFLTGGQPPVAFIFVAAFSLSTVRVFFMPAKNAAIPVLVGEEDLMKANALSAASQNVVQLMALSVSAGVLSALYVLSPTWFFLASVVLNAASFLGSALFIARLPVMLPERDLSKKLVVSDDLRLGLKYIRGREELTVLVIVTILLNLMISPFFVTHVAADAMWFGGKPQTLTWLEAAFWAGMIVGSAIVAKAKIQRPGLGFVWGLGLCGATVGAMAYSQNFWVYLWWNFAAGIAIPFAWIPMQSYTQSTVPDEYRGRVNSVLNMAQMGVQPLGLSVAGGLVDRFGLVNMFLVMGLGMLLASLTGLWSRAFRTARMTDESPQISPQTAAEATG